MRKIGDPVIIVNGRARFHGTIVAVEDGCWGVRYSIRLPGGCVVECSEKYLAPPEGEPAPAPQEAPTN